MRIVYMGTPEFAVEGLKVLVEEGKNVVAVVTMPDKPAGRGHHVQYSPVKEYALSQGLPVLQPERLKDELFVEELRSYRADLQIVTAFRMLPEVVWSMPRLGTINVHASLLPQYRGAAPINWAIINGEKETGLTTFMLKHEIDTGNIILQEKTNIGNGEDVGSLHDRLMAMSREMVLKTVALIEQCDAEGRVLPTTPQADSEATKPAPKLYKETCEIDWNRSVEEVVNLIRGLSPYPAAWTDAQYIPALRGKLEGMVKIYRATPSATSEMRGHILVKCADGYADIEELQLPGKKRMDAKSLLNGIR